MTTLSLSRRRLLMLAPLAAAAAGGVAFWKMLDRMETGQFDPHALDNPLVGKPFPAFNLPAMPPGPGFAATDLRTAVATKPILLNFFASWCVPCAEEADVLMNLSKQGTTIWGICYKDTPEAAGKFLARFGNPYARIADDRAGLTAIDFGVYGFPESFLIDRHGTVTWHIAGPLTDDSARQQLLPALKAAA